MTLKHSTIVSAYPQGNQFEQFSQPGSMHFNILISRGQEALMLYVKVSKTHFL